MVIRGVRKKVAENNIEIKIGDEVLEVVSEIKYLGIIIDKNLNFHINYISKKIGTRLEVLRRISDNLSSLMRCTNI